MGTRLSLDGGDLQLLQEALAYMGRRFFDPQDSAIILDIEDYLESARRQVPSGRPCELTLEKPRAMLLRRVLRAYSDELNRPSSDTSNRERIARMHRLTKRLEQRAGQGILAGLRRWLGFR